MTLRELSQKDVVDIKNGVNYGRADDLEWDPHQALVQKLILWGRPRLFGLLGREKDVQIGWDHILTIGADAILVDLPANSQQSAVKGIQLRPWRQGED